ncbi:hypothetical protein TNCV_3610951 [Trichonephila clavipes]|nr:hypothetical protein TNCV_3610951 [Trichonephila clavipes]
MCTSLCKNSWGWVNVRSSRESTCEELRYLLRYTRAFGDGPRNFEGSWSSLVRGLHTIGERKYENKIDRERQRAGASAQNEWQRGTEANMRKKPKTGEGRGNKRRQSQPGRDVGGAKHETGRNGQNDKRHGRERTEAGAAKEGNKESEQNKIRVIEKASYITPVPGGVGPMTVAMLMQNTYSAACSQIRYETGTITEYQTWDDESENVAFVI